MHTALQVCRSHSRQLAGVWVACVRPTWHHMPRKWPRCGASCSGHIHARRPRLMAQFSCRLRCVRMASSVASFSAMGPAWGAITSGRSCGQQQGGVRLDGDRLDASPASNDDIRCTMC